jgi:hypothetical protein
MPSTSTTRPGLEQGVLDNAARPSGALVYAAKSGNLTGEQFARLKSELELGFQGARNAGRPLLLEGGLDWKPLSLSPKDMDFIEAKNAAAREIALALGVPPMLLGSRATAYTDVLRSGRSTTAACAEGVSSTGRARRRRAALTRGRAESGGRARSTRPLLGAGALRARAPLAFHSTRR